MSDIELNIKIGLSVLALLLTLYGFIPYIKGILNKSITPHVFSWVIWGLTTLIIFFAQMDAGGGIGAWPIGISGCITIFIAFLAYKNRADVQITLLDWSFFIAALAAIPLWYFSQQPLWSVILLTIIDLLGFAPTIRKAYQYPEQESIFFFSLFLTRNLLVIAALESYSVTTVLFPLAVAIACIGLIAIIIVRRARVC
ncbi:hypothetical protein N7931_05745 [Catenovulum sp. 2E275]|uniref:hypothetical protein n=1 Tax=Catenovulum sp. 2E275 TaxID=2980497 RepID=UPI0021CEB961|nr:hypothetical protein [Catenovulum sp. 2E275]MCU4675132.1 hypothetical protein [Catenovulum sp. 2E275]